MDIKGLMIRITNQRDSQLINLKAKVVLSENFSQSGAHKRRFFTLPLEIDTINLLASSWTIVHPIDKDSPLYNLSAEEMIKRDIELMLFVEGYDASYAQNVYSRTSYKSKEVVLNKKFAKILGQDESGRMSINLAHLSKLEAEE